MRELVWTKHAEMKMRYYGLSESRVKRVLTSPSRVERGIAEKTIALLQPAGSKKHPYEIWVMINDTKMKRKIISAWRYPGVTKPGDTLPVEILRELRAAES